MASFTWPPTGTGILLFPNFAAFPATAPNGTLALDLSTDILYVFNTGSNTWIPIGAPTIVFTVGTIDSVSPSANGAVISANSLIMQSASVGVPGLVNNTTQNFSGTKGFTQINLNGSSSGVISIIPQAAAGTFNFNMPTTAGTSGQVLTSQGGGATAMTWTTPATGTVTTVGTFDTQTPNANGAVISGSSIFFQSASATVPGMVNNSTQTFSGVKTFNSNPNMAGLTASQAVVTDASNNLASLAYTSAGTASTIVSRDTNGNSIANNFTSLTTTTSAAGGTTVLTAASTRLQVLNGTGNQTYRLPDATTLTTGTTYDFNANQTGGTLSVVDNGSNAIASLAPGAAGRIILLVNAFPNGVWDKHFFIPSNGVWNTSALSVTGTLSSTSSLSTGVAGSSTGIHNLSGSSSGTVTIQPQAAAGTYNFNLPTTAGTSGQFLTSAAGGSSPMTWTSAGSGGIGTVTSVSIVSANGFSGSVATATTTPAITISTTINAPVLSGNGTAISAATTTGSGSTVVLATSPTLSTSLLLSGSSTGTITIQPQAAAGTYNFNLPTTAGSSGQALLSGGGGATAMSFGTLTVAGGGTGLATLTAHNVLLGEGTSNIAFAAPTATTGVALVSAGASSDPAFGQLNLASSSAVTGTLVVSNGGTGLATLTAHNVMIGEGTSNVAFAAPGATTGVALVSTGATTDPAFGQVNVGSSSAVTGTLLAAQFPALTGDVTTSAGSLATTAAATQANITSLSASAGVAVHGTNTNNNASAGFVGEYVVFSGSGVFASFPATTTYSDYASISLTAGDWDVSATMSQRGTTPSNWSFGISTTTGNSTTGLVFGDNAFNMLTATSTSDSSGSIPDVRFSLSGTTTIYLKFQATYATGSPTASGRISARRRR